MTTARTPSDFLSRLATGDIAARQTLEHIVAEATGNSLAWVQRHLTVSYRNSGQANDPSKPGDLHLGSDHLGRVRDWRVEVTDSRYTSMPRAFRVRKEG